MRWPEITLRVALIIGSALAVIQHVSAWVSAPLGLIAIGATIELAIRPYAGSMVDRVLIGCGLAVVALILLGVGLNFTPSGLTRVTWTLSWVGLGLAVLIWRRGLEASASLSRIRLRRSYLWAVPVVAVLVAAGLVAQAGVQAAKEPVLALSMVSKSAHTVTVQIDATSVDGAYQLKAESTTPGAQGYTSRKFEIHAGQSGAHIVKEVPTNISARWTITLASVTGTQARELIVDVGSASTWQNIWVANFNGPAGSKVTNADWTYTLGNGGFGDREVETLSNSPENAHLNGQGALEITPILQNGKWTSARLNSKRSFLFAPGGEYSVSASIQLPNPSNGLGYWPAFWMLAPGTKLHTGEIDVMEDTNGYAKHSATFHCGYDRTNSHQCESGIGSGLVSCPACNTSYNTFSVIVNRLNPGAEQMQWYLDGRQIFAVSESSVGAAYWNAALSQPFTIILEVAMGGGYPTDVCHCTTPTGQTTSGASMYVRSLIVAKLVS